VLNKSNLIKNEENNINNRNFTNFNNNNSNENYQEKERLDYELSKLEEQYKDILSKFSFLSKKRGLLN